jgi:hypothetical protein
MSVPARSEFTIDDLPRFSPWPARLLGLTVWNPRKRTSAEVSREFDRDKWGALLQRYEGADGSATLETVEDWALGSDEPSLCSVGKRFELQTPRECLRRHYQVVIDTLQRLLPASCVVELGAGYGGAALRLAADSRFSGTPLYAAEYTRSGRELLVRLARAAGVPLQVGQCDLSKAPMCDFEPPSGGIIFTCMAAHYIPELADQFVEVLNRLRPRAVAHFEPCYEHFDPLSLMGAMRRRYIEVNDYNRNLVSLLRRHAASDAITILDEQPAVIGVNPLLPISVIVWRCRG